MVLSREFLGKNFEDFGVLESQASGTGIIARAREVLKSKDSSLDLDELTAEDVFEAGRKGEPWAQEIVEKTIDYLTIAIANLEASFNPEVIVLGGSVTHSADLLVKPILQRLKGMIPIMPRLVVSSLGLQATVMGAITNVLHNTSNYYVVHKLS
jgi:glucokinase